MNLIELITFIILQEAMFPMFVFFSSSSEELFRNELETAVDHRQKYLINFYHFYFKYLTKN